MYRVYAAWAHCLHVLVVLDSPTLTRHLHTNHNFYTLNLNAFSRLHKSIRFDFLCNVEKGIHMVDTQTQWVSVRAGMCGTERKQTDICVFCFSLEYAACARKHLLTNNMVFDIDVSYFTEKESERAFSIECMKNRKDKNIYIETQQHNTIWDVMKMFTSSYFVWTNQNQTHSIRMHWAEELSREREKLKQISNCGNVLGIAKRF